MSGKTNRRFSILSAAVAAVALGGATVSAQNIIVDDNFDDGDLTVNVNGVGSGFSPANTGGTGVETGGAFFTDTSGSGNFALQAISSRDGFDFWNSGGALIEWTTGNVTSTLDADQDLLAFPGGTSADWRHELGIVNYRRNNLDSTTDEFWQLNGTGAGQAGFYINLFYDQAGSGDGNDLLVTGNIRAANKDKPAFWDQPAVGAEVIATFTFNLYQGQTDLVTSLFVDDTGFSLSFSEAATFTIEPFMGPSFQVQNGSLVGNWSEMGEAPFTDEFINSFGHDAFVTAQGQNLGAGRGMGSVSHILVDASQPTTPPAETFWDVALGDWSNDANWTMDRPNVNVRGIIDNDGTAQLNTFETAGVVDIGSEAGASGTLEISSGGTLDIPDGMLRVGQAPGATGNLLMTGGSVNIQGGFNHIIIGDLGEGTLEMSGDASTSSQVFAVALAPDSVGSATLSDNASITTVNGAVEIGFTAGSVGSLVMGGNASISTTGTGPRLLRVGDRGTGTLEMNGGSIDAGLIIIGDSRGSGTGSGHFVMNDGVVTLDSGDRIIIGFGADNAVGGTGNQSEGSLTMTGGTINILAGALPFPDLVVGWDGITSMDMSGGTMNIDGVVATSLSPGFGEAGQAEAHITHSGGTINALGYLLAEWGITDYTLSGTAEMNALNRVRLALHPTAISTFTQTGGTVNSALAGQDAGFDSVVIGERGQATYSIEGGVLNANTLLIGQHVTDFEEATVPSVGQLNINGGTVNVAGHIASGVAGHGELNQAAGELTIADALLLANGDFFATSVGTHNHSGGTLNVGTNMAVGFLNGNATSTISGGTVNVGNRIRIWSTGTLNYDGGTINAVELQVDGAVVDRGPGGRVNFGAGAGVSLAVDTLVVDAAGGAIVDLADNELVVRNGDAAAINALVASGRAGGSWDGAGIQSSVAAVESGRALGVGMSGDDVVVRFTWGGDATLDGAVTIADLGILAANWQAMDRLWFHGDFNYDTSVTIADLGILAANWQQGAASGGMSFEEAMAMFDVFDGVVVPEPSALGLVGLGMLALRRRRQSRIAA